MASSIQVTYALISKSPDVDIPLSIYIYIYTDTYISRARGTPVGPNGTCVTCTSTCTLALVALLTLPP